MKIIVKFINTTIIGFTFLCRLASRGFYFILSVPYILLSKIFKENKSIFKIKKYYKKKQEEPFSFLVTAFIILFSASSFVIIKEKEELSHPIINDEKNKTIIQEKSQDDNQAEEGNIQYKEYKNIFMNYSSKNINEINIMDLKNTNNDIIAWLQVDGTNINYPIVQTEDNEYYLNNNIEKKESIEGWPFMDYRNNIIMSDNNTIFYGHNLLNKTSFGSLSNIFTKKWFETSTRKITLKTMDKVYTYKIFSCYNTGDEVEYLQNLFYSTEEYQDFLNKITKRSKFNFNIKISSEDYIITLSTCSDDNKGRKVVHAKLVDSKEI